MRRNIMQNIDRLNRLVSFSRRRVLIVLVVLSGSFLAFNYAVLSENFYLCKRHLITETFPVVRITITTTATATRETRDSRSIANSSGTSTTESYNPFLTSTVISPTGNSNSQSGSVSLEPPINVSLSETDNSNNNVDYLSNEAFENELSPSTTEDIVNSFFIFTCKNVTVRRAQKRKKNLVVYENFIPAARSVKCYESITYTTHGDYRYLDNLIPLVERWNGPISVAVYTPGDDLGRTLRVISYLRDCSSHRISEFVTFHLFFEAKYSQSLGQTGSQFQWMDALYEKERWADCSIKPNLGGDQEPTFRVRKRLLYPVNIARNIARSASTTHYVLASDIELYPSINLIPDFFRMLKEESEIMAVVEPENNISRATFTPRVFVLPIFEVKKGIKAPKIKKDLIALLQKETAVPFHHFICRECHLMPKFDEWKRASNRTGLRVFHKAKRKPPYHYWEPIYIGTKYEPLYDERLSWEGLRDKMTQGYILCALNYDFMVLDNAFLVHRPGIKRLSHKVTQTVLRQDRLINLRIKAELFRRFGKHEGCFL